MKILARRIKTRRLVSSVFGNRDCGYVIEEQNGISSLCVEFCRLFVFNSYYVTHYSRYLQAFVQYCVTRYYVTSYSLYLWNSVGYCFRRYYVMTFFINTVDKTTNIASESLTNGKTFKIMLMLIFTVTRH